MQAGEGTKNCQIGPFLLIYGGGFHTRVRGTMFVRDGAVTPGPSRKCDITFFVKGRPKSARQSRDSTVATRSVQSVTVLSSRVSRECRSPGLRSPPFKNARRKDHIHTFLFSEIIPEIIHFSLKSYVSGIAFPKITLHVFVCDSENYMEKLFGNYFLGKSHVSFTNECLQN